MATSTKQPTLSVSTGSSYNSASVRSRPQGARRRGMTVGLYIANPDLSDSDSDVPPSRNSPRNNSIPAPSTNSTLANGANGTSGGGSGYGGGLGLRGGSGQGGSASGSATGATSGTSSNGSPVRPSPTGASPPSTGSRPGSGPARAGSAQSGHNTGAGAGGGLRVSVESANSIAPNGLSSSPGSTRFYMPQQLPLISPVSPLPTPGPYGSPPLMASDRDRAMPPQPPPQPERHARRALTTPDPPRQSHLNTTSTSNNLRDAPNSPNRALPPLPPVKASTAPTPTSPQTHLPYQSSSQPIVSSVPFVSNPEDMVTSAGYAASRNRSGSVNQKVLLQATVDNEQFIIVDISGVSTPDGIVERMFSKLRFRDEDYPTLSIYRTEVGESPTGQALSPQDLLVTCQTEGDSRANLKFLVMHTGIPGSSTAPVVPPQSHDSYRSRPGVPPIVTSVPAPPYMPRDSTHRSNSSLGSLGSQGEAMDRSRTNASDYDDDGGRLQPGWTNSNNRSPVTDPPTSSTAPGGLIAPLRHGIVSSPHLPLTNDMHTQDHEDESTYRARAGPSSHAGPSGGGTEGLDLDGMDEATLAVIMKLQQEDAEEDRRKRERERELLMEDERLALQAQQSEREVWHVMQQLQAQQRQREEQVRADEQAARQVDLAERRAEEEVLRQRRESDVSPSVTMSPSVPTWEDHREPPGRGTQFAQNRRERADQYYRMGRDGNGAFISDETAAPYAMANGRHTPYNRRPSDSQPERSISTPSYPYPASSFSAAGPSYSVPPPPTHPSLVNNHGPPPMGPYNPPPPSAQERARLAQLNNRAPNRGRSGPPTSVYQPREDSRPLGPARSTDNLRMYNGPMQPSRQYSAGVRAPITPVTEQFSPVLQHHRPSQDGRYPESVGLVQFPSPRPFPETQSPPRMPTMGSPPGPSAGVRRPSTLYDESPPQRLDYQPSSLAYARGRSGSESHAFPTPAPSAHPDNRSHSHSSQLPYAHTESLEWLTGHASQRRGTVTSIGDAESTTGTHVSDSNTIRPHADEGTDESTATARAEDWRNQLLDRRIDHGGPMASADYFLANLVNGDDDDETDSATLFHIPKPQASTTSSSPAPPALDMHGAMSSPKPNLTVNTTHGDSNRPPSASDSEMSDAEGWWPPSSQQAPRSVGAGGQKKDQWHVRPEFEQVYDHLQEWFPQIDLDKPVFEPAASPAPSTPNSESSPRTTLDLMRPPPVHPDRRQPTPKAEDLPVKPPPQHPIRATASAAVNTITNVFNRSENRKSIRNVAEYRKKSLLKANRERNNAHAPMPPLNDERLKRASSMWDHRAVEITPSKLKQEYPSLIPESPSAETGDARAPTLNWVKGKLIGKGSYGRVYLALNVTTGDMMAVKQVEQPVTEQDRADRRQQSVVEALKSEISLLKDLYHPNIVAYLGCDEANAEYLSIFLEYVPGGTIASIYRTPHQARFEEQLVKYFTKQILDGLAYLHAKHIWHRDLKGDNILVDASGVCKISDFGISKQTENAYDSNAVGTIMKGSVFWMAPEMIKSPSDASTYSGKIDIWSLGCVVVEMWSGKRPWYDLEQMPAILAIASNQATPPLPPGISLSPPANDFLYGKCLSLDSRARPVARDLLQHPFITEVDPSWTFASSKIGKAVAKRGKKSMRSASSSTADRPLGA